MKLAVFVHDPLDATGWQSAEASVTPDEAAALARSWGARGWRVLCVSAECIAQQWRDLEFLPNVLDAD